MGRPSVACLLSVVIAMTCGCAKPYPPGESRIDEPQGFVHRFSTMPRLVVEEQPVPSFRLSPEERQALEKARDEFNKARDERVSQITDSKMSGRNSPEGMIAECVIRTLVILSPLCIFIVPVAYGTGTLVEHGKASRSQPFVAALPSEAELLAVHEKILIHVTAAGIADRLRAPGSDRKGSSADQFPRLLITPSFVTFGTERTFQVRFLVQGQPSADVSWPQTEHVFHVGYYQDAQRLISELSQGEARLAESISTTYGLWAYGGPERQTAAPSLAGVVEQEPRLQKHGCAPYHAQVGGRYLREDGSRVTIVRLLGESPACLGARPIAVEIEPG